MSIERNDNTAFDAKVSESNPFMELMEADIEVLEGEQKIFAALEKLMKATESYLKESKKLIKELNEKEEKLSVKQISTKKNQANTAYITMAGEIGRMLTEGNVHLNAFKVFNPSNPIQQQLWQGGAWDNGCKAMPTIVSSMGGAQQTVYEGQYNLENSEAQQIREKVQTEKDVVSELNPLIQDLRQNFSELARKHSEVQNHR